jgi:iduronate 2-sulfatase
MKTLWGRATAAIGSALLVCTAVTPCAAAKKLNAVFIMADDLNCDLGCYGHPQVKTPQIDRLAKQGVRFEHAYCQYPVCNPSRVSMLSGRRPQTTRVVDLVTPTRSTLGDTVMLPEYFRKRGYTTVKLGKIFHTGVGFEDPRSWDFELTETSEAKNPPAEQIAERRGERVIVLNAADDATWDGRLASEAAAQLHKLHATPRPFFLAVGFRRPHVPYIAPRRYFDLYPPDSIPPLDEPAGHLQAIPRLALPYICYGAEKLDADHRAGVVAAYHASVSFLDAQIGVILDAIDRADAWDNTVVVLASDHGYHLGEHGGLWHKMTLFESACHVPLIIAAPGKSRGSETGAIVELLDLYPTLVDLCGLPSVAGLEGTSLEPLLLNPHRPWQRVARTVVSRVDGHDAHGALDPDRLGTSVRSRRWRYTEWPDGTHELYDHDTDPQECHNLANSPDYAAIVAEQRQLLVAPRK